MKSKITGIIVFISGLGLSLYLLYVLIVYFDKDTEFIEFLLLIGLLISCISAILYPIWTRFGDPDITEIKKVDYENKLLQKQIENAELKKKLSKD